MDKAAHADAAKVFVKWLFSREGQISFQKSQGACDSARIDFLKGMFHRSTGDGKASSTFAFGILEWMDVDEVRKFIDESVKEPQKG
jgi:hypothetical protein